MRAQFLYVAANNRGDVWQGAVAAVFEHGTNTPAAGVYADEVGGGPITSLLTDDAGKVEFWLATDRTVDVEISDNGGTAFHPHEGAAFPRPFTAFRVTLGAHATQGPQGVTGATGAAGASVTGATGPSGPIGVTGPSGSTGATGPVGASVTGATGPQGNPSTVAGPQGPTGPMGAWNWQGPYFTGAVYYVGHAVEWKGSTWGSVLIGQHAHPPDDPDNLSVPWQLIARAGDDGTPGTPGPTGPFTRFIGPFDPNYNYSTGDGATYLGNAYYANAAGHLATPPASPYVVPTVTGPRGLDGPTGTAGAAGSIGEDGFDGGAVTIRYLFDSDTTDSDPGPGNLRLDNGTQNLSTIIRADVIDVRGTDWTTVLDHLDDAANPVVGQLRLVNIADETKWMLFDIYAVLTPAGYRNITGLVIGSSLTNPFLDGDPIALCFTRSGDVGAGISGQRVGATVQSVVDTTNSTGTPATLLSKTATIIGPVSVKASGNGFNSSAGMGVHIRLLEDGVVIADRWIVSSAGGALGSFNFDIPSDAAPGSHTWVLDFSTYGSGVAHLIGGVLSPVRLFVVAN